MDLSNASYIGFDAFPNNAVPTMTWWIKSSMGLAMRIALIMLACDAQRTALSAESVTVRYREGVAHGFLVLRTQDGKAIADGDSTQVVEGDRITNQMSFKFRDGSVYEETTVFLQRGMFRLLKDHVIQKGPQFKPSMETSIDATSGQVTVRYTDDHGKDRVLSKRLEMPSDVANGILFTLLKDIDPNVSQTTVAYVAATPEPRLVQLKIIPQNHEPFSIGSHNHKAVRYVVTVKIGGVAGLITPLVGKQPPNMQAWMLAEGAPAFVRFDGPLYSGGPVWRMELAIPAAWPGDRLTHINK